MATCCLAPPRVRRRARVGIAEAPVPGNADGEGCGPDYYAAARRPPRHIPRSLRRRRPARSTSRGIRSPCALRLRQLIQEADEQLPEPLDRGHADPLVG